MLQMGKDPLLMVSLVIISTIDLDDWMPGSRAPGLFVFAPLNSREKERGQGVGTLFRLNSSTFQNFLFTQKRSDRGSSLQMNAYAITITEMPSFSTIITFDG